MNVDKVPDTSKEAAKKTFQTIVSAYAILSDERRRKRFDTTGNTSESLDLEDDDFDWLDFFRAQWQDTVNSTTILDYKGKYQGSDEEKMDVITAYEKHHGNMSRIFQDVQLSNMLDDEDRFRKWIDDAIEGDRVAAYPNYYSETQKSKQQRRNRAEREAREAEVHFQELKNRSKVQSKGGDLAAMIQQRQQSRAQNFLSDLEAKYATPNGTSKPGKRKRRKEEEPAEEAFQEMAARVRRSSKSMNGSKKAKEDSDIDVGSKSPLSGQDTKKEDATKKTDNRSRRKGRKARP